jgi:transcriptional regulator of acetoin/glycerol metabolism
MQTNAFPLDLNSLVRMRQNFITTGHIDRQVDPLVAKSWRRCALSLNPNTPANISSLSDKTLSGLLINMFELIAVSHPVMEDLYQFIVGLGAVVCLLDNTTCVLEIIGDDSAMHHIGLLGLRRGAFWGEGHVGTNAFAVALWERSPAQVVGPEHYLSAMDSLACAAAPIYDPTGWPIGVIGIATQAELACPYMLSAVSAAAQAIGKQLQADDLLQDANRHLSELNATLEAISEGVLSWNTDGIITHINSQAGEMLDLDPHQAVGGHIEESLTLPDSVIDAALRNQPLRDAKVSFMVGGTRRVDCLVSLQPVCECEKDGQLTSYIITLRPIEQVHQLVSRLVGARATLSLSDIVGQSSSIERVRRQALAAARSRANVLLLGESGTGKHAAARAIHQQSSGSDNPFLAINCRAIPRELIISEFMGYEGGAFSGANAEGRPSKFELASGGTIFLDEVEALPLEMQAALVRVIESGHVMRLGSTRVIPVDVRLIASSDVNLEAEMAEGNFRADLLYCLSSFVIEIPSLRERPEDLPMLIDNILFRLSSAVGGTVSLDPAARCIMLNYPWPGNVRELEHVLERAIIISEGGLVLPEHLPQAVRYGRLIAPGMTHAEPVPTLREAERDAIVRAGYACRGNVTHMAKLLEVGRTTIWRKMKEFNLSTDDFRNGEGVFRIET